MTNEDIARIAYGVEAAYEHSQGNASFPAWKDLHPGDIADAISSVNGEIDNPTPDGLVWDGATTAHERALAYIFRSVVHECLALRKLLELSSAAKERPREYQRVRWSASSLSAAMITAGIIPHLASMDTETMDAESAAPWTEDMKKAIFDTTPGQPSVVFGQIDDFAAEDAEGNAPAPDLSNMSEL